MQTPATLSPARRRTRRKEARPGELLAAALALFVEKGYAATRVEEVAARAGVSKGTLFLYFQSKEALFQAVVHENAGRHLAEALRELADFQGSSADLLRSFLRRWWQVYGSTPAAGLSALLMSESAHFPELARHYQDAVIAPAHELLRRLVQRGIERGEFRPVNVARLVHLVVAPLLQMVTWQQALGHCCPQIEEDRPLALIDLHADLLIRGLRPDAVS
ncbi:MAG TPA: TetR/AcrR family transcriptional regulator [Ottowia sp.]|uniref:TetR/AcrR family transcriptional regulator n=1 Tax=Ottowia sp. TaxID=1898956 RepID=UPI002C00043A|nr:TetR/AcrR family transcriptional regulator [Ottowia sp.]HMN21619.1 TetR/AcrR family transcriptional regulator [Ottowia sp.]